MSKVNLLRVSTWFLTIFSNKVVIWCSEKVSKMLMMQVSVGESKRICLLKIQLKLQVNSSVSTRFICYIIVSGNS